MESTELTGCVGKDVVVDTSTSFLYIGKLESVAEFFMTISDVDVHDCSQSTTTKEVYVLEARKFGIRRNRTRVRVRLDKVVSVSLLEEVIVY